MKDYIEERAIEIASYIIEKKATVRQTAKKFGISKSTVHKDVTDLSLIHILCGRYPGSVANETGRHSLDYIFNNDVYNK